MTYHKQSVAKVNVLVDENLVGVIQALSRFPLLRTIESCEGEAVDKDGKEWATVFFEYGDGWKEPSEFVFGFLGPHLADIMSDHIHVSLYVNQTWGRIQGLIKIRPGCIKWAVESINSLADSYYS